MANKNVAVKKCFTFTWTIENVSFCWQKVKNYILSPNFVVNMSRQYEWALCLYPRGSTDSNYIALYLLDKGDNKTLDIEISEEFQILGANDAILNSIAGESLYSINRAWGYHKYANREEVFRSGRNTFIPNNSLTIRCKLFSIDGKPLDGCCFARTIIKVERKSFICRIENFSTLKSDQPTTFHIQSEHKKVILTFDVIVTGGQNCDEVINIVVTTSDDNIKFFTFGCYLSSSKEEKINCGEQECFGEDLLQGVKFPLRFTKKELMENENLDLSNDILSLNCECAFTTGIAFEGIQSVDVGIIPALNRSEGPENPVERPQSTISGPENPVERPQTTISSSLKDDLISIYKQGLLCDTKLHTETETFPAHTLVLSARSKVFRAMFENDMKEKSMERVDITDIDADTVRQMLLYLYSDTLEDLQWEKASLLYAAADKYEIIPLKNDCSAFMKGNFSPVNACDILRLADLHNDQDLKNAVQNYIFNNDCIFHSKEWESVMSTNPSLASETLFQNLKTF